MQQLSCNSICEVMSDIICSFHEMIVYETHTKDTQSSARTVIPMQTIHREMYVNLSIGIVAHYAHGN